MATAVDEPQAPEAEPEAPANRRLDTELRTLNQIIRLFEGLPFTAQPRVMAYLQSRFQDPVDTNDPRQ